MGYASKERLVEYQRAYRAAHRDTARAATIKWRAENGERRRAVDAAWRAANRERTRLASKRFAEAHPERIRDNTALQRARRKGAVREKVNRMQVWERDQGICGICGLVADPTDWHVDHIVPIAQNGEHTFDNCQVAHPACNRRKGARLWTL